MRFRSSSGVCGIGGAAERGHERAASVALLGGVALMLALDNAFAS